MLSYLEVFRGSFFGDSFFGDSFFGVFFVLLFRFCFFAYVSVEYKGCLNGYIVPIDGNLTGNTTQSQCELGSNGNEKVFLIPQISRTGASLSDVVDCHT